MPVFRVERNKGYTVMSNYHLRDKSLSLKAKGLLSQILSLPEDWDYTLSGLCYINRESKDAIRSAVNELERAGYIERHQTTDESGKFSSNEYIIHEQPVSLPPSLDKPSSENPTTGKPTSENPTQLNKDRVTNGKPPANPYKWTAKTISGILERVEYLGHTVNFKTSKPSFKSKKTVWNNPSEWVIFEKYLRVCH